jgi:hypothetical protein
MLPAVIDTLSAAVPNGQPDSVLGQSTEHPPMQKRRRLR